MEALKWLLNKNFPIKLYNSIQNTIFNGHLHVLEFLFKNLNINEDLDYELYEIAINNNHSHILKWFNDNICSNKIISFKNKIFRNKIFKKKKEKKREEILECYYINKYIELLQNGQMKQKFFHCFKNLSIYAAQNNRIDVLELLKNKYNYLFKNIILSYEAAINGNLNLLKWLTKNNFPLDEKVFMFYISNHHNIYDLYDLFYWLIENKYKIDISWMKYTEYIIKKKKILEYDFLELPDSITYILYGKYDYICIIDDSDINFSNFRLNQEGIIPNYSILNLIYN